MSTEKNYKPELVGVFGCPVAENPTVVMMEAAFNALGLNFRYLNIEVRPEDLQTAFQGLRAFNMKGINLTIPHKVEVLKYLDVVADDARLMGAVNTVYLKGGKLFGENTDGKGFITSLHLDANFDPSGKNVVVLGAGGAARAITVELALHGARQISVVNRGRDRGMELVNLLSSRTPVKALFTPWDAAFAVPDETHVLVNATSIGLFPDVDARPNLDYSTIHPGLIVCDVIPNPPHTVFLKEAKKRGARTFDGLGMLVHQGTIAFKLWTGSDAPVEVMKMALMKEFGLG